MRSTKLGVDVKNSDSHSGYLFPLNCFSIQVFHSSFSLSFVSFKLHRSALLYQTRILFHWLTSALLRSQKWIRGCRPNFLQFSSLSVSIPPSKDLPPIPRLFRDRFKNEVISSSIIGTFLVEPFSYFLLPTYKFVSFSLSLLSLHSFLSFNSFNSSNILFFFSWSFVLLQFSFLSFISC